MNQGATDGATKMADTDKDDFDSRLAAHHASKDVEIARLKSMLREAVELFGNYETPTAAQFTEWQEASR